MRPRTRAATTGIAAASLALAAGAARADAPRIVELTQVACQFVEAEGGVDRDFKATRKADCEAINARTAKRRLAEAAALRLTPGKYVFRVRNKDVPYELGFWLREEGYDWRNPVHKLTKVNVSGGGLAQGESRDYEVELKPGAYVYSCPLNTTPDYTLVVAEQGAPPPLRR